MEVHLSICIPCTCNTDWHPCCSINECMFHMDMLCHYRWPSPTHLQEKHACCHIFFTTMHFYIWCMKMDLRLSSHRSSCHRWCKVQTKLCTTALECGCLSCSMSRHGITMHSMVWAWQKLKHNRVLRSIVQCEVKTLKRLRMATPACTQLSRSKHVSISWIHITRLEICIAACSNCLATSRFVTAVLLSNSASSRFP